MSRRARRAIVRLAGGLAPFALLGLAACTSAPGPAPPPAVSPRPAPVGPRAGDPARRIVLEARSLLASPYLAGGEGPEGFDCSGLTAYVFRRVGVRLPRTAEAQGAAGRWVAPDELAPGDLVFFGDSRDKPHHVGVVVSPPGAPLAMIHASSSRGVIETEVTASPYWLERLRFGRRVLPR